MMVLRKVVAPANAGVQGPGSGAMSLDSGVRRNDADVPVRIFGETIEV